MPSPRRLLAALTAPLLAAVPLTAGLAGPAAAATPPAARDISHFACNPALVPAPAFSDVSAATLPAFYDAIACLAGYQITEGFPDGTYRPAGSVSRGEMALFIYRAAELTDKTFSTKPYGFTDISSLPASEQDAINALADAGVVHGYSSTLYGPDLPVSRAQMATFLNGLEAKMIGTSGFPVTATDYFTDVSPSSPHFTDINAIASAGITQGIGNNLYDPGGAVTRGQMAAFITRLVDAVIALGQLPSQYPGGYPAFTGTPAAGTQQAVEYNASSNNTASYTFDVGRATSVDIALFHPSDLSVGPGGVVTFGTATPIAKGGDVSIESVNGSTSSGAQPGSSSVTEVNGAKPAGGKITFTVGANGLDDVVPVVWADLPGASGGKADNKLDLISGYSAEPFGAGWQADFVPAEAATGSSSPTVVSSPYAVNDTLGYFVGSVPGTLPGQSTTATYYFNGPNDTFGSPKANDVGLSAFEGMLTPQDQLNVSYNTDQTKTSTFTITTDYVPPVSNLVAAARSGNTVQLTFTPSSQPDAIYDIWADTSNTGTPSGSPTYTYTPPNGNGVPQLTDTVNAPSGTYDFIVEATSPTSGATSTPVTSNQVTVPVPAPAVLPNGAIVEHDAPYVGSADRGDLLLVYFNQPMALGAAPTLTVSSGTGTGAPSATISASDAQFALNSTTLGLSAPGTVLEVQLTAPVKASGAAGSLSYPLTVTGASGITSSGGQSWTPPTGSAAVTIGDTAPQFLASDAAVGDTTFTVSFNQPVTGTNNPGGVANPTAFQVTSDGSTPDFVQSVTQSSDGLTVTITVSNPLAKGATISTPPGETLSGANGASGAPTPFTLIH